MNYILSFSTNKKRHNWNCDCFVTLYRLLLRVLLSIVFIMKVSNFKGGYEMGFFPFGVLYCLTLFCLVTIRIYSIRNRNKNDEKNLLSILKYRFAKGELDEAEYEKLKTLLTK